jgi:hypothetical protein
LEDLQQNPEGGKNFVLGYYISLPFVVLFPQLALISYVLFSINAVNKIPPFFLQITKMSQTELPPI